MLRCMVNISQISASVDFYRFIHIQHVEIEYKIIPPGTFSLDLDELLRYKEGEFRAL